MRSTAVRHACFICAAWLVAATAGAQEFVPKLKYSAQRRPRIAVMKFENTNELATKQAFGASVSAMLVTFLKSQSQLVVVERQNIDKILDEWKLDKTGATDVGGANPIDAATRAAVFQSIDAVLDGRVTVLGSPEAPQNQQIEIDARLVAKEDAHIISAGQRSGPIGQLRDIVAQLGVQLEQDFLRPYYGSLTVTAPEPANVRIFLTPVLSSTAYDDEKPPVTLDRTLSMLSTQGGRQGTYLYEKWVTKPNVATISNVLAGWYTLRLERPGYDGQETNNALVEVRDVLGEELAPAAVGSGAGPRLAPDQQRFLVQIRALASTRWPADGIPIRLKKRGGTIALRVKRQYVDDDYRDAAELPQLKTILQGNQLEINYADDVKGAGVDRSTSCVSKSAQEIFTTFTGGALVLQDHHRVQKGSQALLPIGSYATRLFGPQYMPASVTFDVTAGADERPVLVDLTRQTATLQFTHHGGVDPAHHVVVEGRETKVRRSLPLEGAQVTFRDLPVDFYTVSTDLPGFNEWRRTVGLMLPENARLPAEEDVVRGCDLRDWAPPPIAFKGDLKTQPWLAGRLDALNMYKDPHLHGRLDVMQHLEAAMQSEAARKQDARASRAQTQQLLVQSTAASAENTDAERILERLRLALREIDLLYFDDNDMTKLAGLPGVAAVVRQYIENGGAVFCFVSSPADYASVLGSSINLDQATQRGEIELRPGSVSGLQLDVKQDLAAKRSFPVLRSDKKQAPSDWRVLAFRKKGKEPSVLEKGEAEKGGYVLVWLDSPDDTLMGHDVTKEAVAAAEKRALAWSQYLMYRRLGPGSPELTTAKQRLDTLVFSVKREVKAGQ